MARGWSVSEPRFQLLNDAMAWMMRHFGRGMTLQEMMVGLCIWRIAHRNETTFTGQQITDELDIPYSTATRILRRWIDRGVIEIAPIPPEDARHTQYVLTEKGISLREVLARWDPQD